MTKQTVYRWGNTPAYAGKTNRPRPAQGASGKHPRLRGEDELRAPVGGLALETPPLTRGRLFYGVHDGFGTGNTPAYAGKTREAVPDRPPFSKHPRLRGEDGHCLNFKVIVVETPPLTRGRPDIDSGLIHSVGNTPAYAGKTGRPLTPATRPRKHPRLRGEDKSWNHHHCRRSETPPLTRGRQQAARRLRRRDGNTPAYAGKTSRTTALSARSRKHPRLRGEDDDKRRPLGEVSETPPLTRGRLSRKFRRRTSLGNTPAYAGKTPTFFAKNGVI